jgi:Ni,Fe-hydrogenase III small subunit
MPISCLSRFLDHVPSALYPSVSSVMSFFSHALADVLLKVLPVDILLEGIPPSPSNPLRCTDSPEDTLVSS